MDNSRYVAQSSRSAKHEIGILSPEFAPELFSQLLDTALLRGDRAPQLPQDSLNRPTAAATASVGTIGRPNAPERGKPCDPPHELSLAERVETGYLNPGWTSAAWAHRLQQLADRCEGTRAGTAETYRLWAANVKKNERGLA